MAFFQWNDQLSVKIAQIDMQHKKLVDMVNEMFEAMQAGKGKDVLGKILAELIQYTRTHFATEERLMQTHGYQDFAAHKKEHDDLAKQVLDLESKFKAGEPVMSSSVGTFLKGWLVNHIKGTDMKYAPFLNSKGVR